MLGRIRMMTGEKKEKGFTLIELIVVMAILAILAMIAVPKFTGVTKKAKQDANDSNVQLIANAAELYYDSHKQTMPDNIGVLVEEGYLKENPIQPVEGTGNYSISPSTTDTNKITIIPGVCDTTGVPASTGTLFTF